MLVSNKDLMVPARKSGYAIPALNVQNLESLTAVAEAAVEERSPVILAISPSVVKYAGMPYIIALAKTATNLSPVPMSIHLDHGEDYDICAKCIDAGFSSVMIDGSFLSYEENIAVTKKVVSIAHPKGVSVEAELGKLAGIEERSVEEKEAILTDPDNAKDFVERTGVDSLAVAIGTSHGAYKFKSESKLDIERLKKISQRISIPLVLHGASSVPEALIEKASKYGAVLTNAKGIPEGEIKKAVALGIAKVNVDTDLRLALTGAVREVLATQPKEFDPRKILGPAKEAMKQVAKSKMQLLGSAGKA
ncbi:MAG TPA: class II fructose-1,6-bisphosphate aldolase [Candidatus Nanoarchaeia archaeon]|nr:class II fructose-1,6-bisphosphate aldolase [Candidatus Nanoarchaeia archaeon]